MVRRREDDYQGMETAEYTIGCKECHSEGACEESAFEARGEEKQIPRKLGMTDDR
jgi:hypothetical protein